MTVQDTVRDIVTTMAPAAPGVIADGHRLIDDLGFDSLRLMELTVVLERAFGLPPYRPEQLAGVLTVGAVVDLVAQSTVSP